MSKKYFASCSFGKDSIATVLLALEHNEPFDEVVYCEVMFDNIISGEPPEHRDFIYNKAIPEFERRGVKVVVVHSEATYMTNFFHVKTKGKRIGQMTGFPLCGRCNIQRDCKLRPIHKYLKTLGNDYIQYIGIAADEPKRLLRLVEGKQISLLDKYGYTEEDAKALCQKEGLLSPIYEYSNRGGCWFCPNMREPELRHLYDYHPDLWNRLLELQKVPNKATELFNRTQTFAEIDKRFRDMKKERPPIG